MAEWIETFKGAIAASEYDPESHMNTRAYVSRFDQATWFLLSTIGLTPRVVRKQNRRIAVVRQTHQFIAELQGGELITIRSGFLAVGEKHLRFLHRMFDAETNKMVATSDSTAVLASLETGKSMKPESEIMDRAREHLVTANDVEGLDEG